MQASLNQLREAAKQEDKQMELLYFDEAGVCNVPTVQRSWSPLGKPHSADASIGRKRVNVLGALNYAQGTLAFEVHEHVTIQAPHRGKYSSGAGLTRQDVIGHQ